MGKLKQKPTSFRLIKRYVETLLPKRGALDALANVSTYCIFIGHKRSGSTLLGSVLDAHPSVIIAHEFNTLKHIRAGFGRRQLYTLLIENSQRYADHDRKGGGFHYPVKDQWQGRFDHLRVIGDKKASSTTKRLRQHPELLTKLAKVTADKVRVINTIRNPYDNITHRDRRDVDSLTNDIGTYFENCEAIQGIRQAIEANSKLDARVLDVRHEDYVAAPRDQLRRLCEFLELEATPQYLDSCAAIVNPSTNKARYRGDWTPELISRIAEEMERFPFLQGYSYEQ